jgi:hypothetical protein
MKPSRAAESCPGLAKSSGVTAFFWMTQKKIPGLVQPGRVHRGADHDRVRVRLGQPADGGLAAVIRAVTGDDEDPGRVLVLRAAHDLAGQVHERLDPRRERRGGEHLPGVHVQPGQQREGALAPVLVLVADGPAGRGGQGGMQAAAGIDLRPGVKGQDPVTCPERLALVKPLVQVHDHLRPGPGVRVAGVDPRLVLPRPDRVPGQDPQHRRRGDRGADQPPGGQLGGQFRTGPVRQRYPGSGRQLAGQCHHCRPCLRADLARPPRPGQITESFPAAVSEPAPPLTHGVLADAQVTGDPRVGAPHRGS